MKPQKGAKAFYASLWLYTILDSRIQAWTISTLSQPRFGALDLVSTGCERILQVTLDGKNPPTFTFNGSGEISWVFIYQVTPDGKVPPAGSAFWRLSPKKRMAVSESPPITYGVVPDGYVQEVPANGSPPPLQEGKTYGFGANTHGQPGRTVWFTIQNGKSVQVPKTDPPNKPY